MLTNSQRRIMAADGPPVALGVTDDWCRGDPDFDETA